MSIRMIASELYQFIQKVEKLEKKIQDAPLEKQDELKDQLRKVRAERDRMRRALDGEKG
ncbi:hypothetical protein ACFL03_03080 [Thermodesulfobacteriota bacterium]